jgi:hypothetical protein
MSSPPPRPSYPARPEIVKGGVLPTSHVSAPMPKVQPTRPESSQPSAQAPRPPSQKPSR